MADEPSKVPRGLVCPRCGSPTTGTDYCQTCGLHLADQDELPTAERWKQLHAGSAAPSQQPTDQRPPSWSDMWSGLSNRSRVAAFSAVGAVLIAVALIASVSSGGGDETFQERIERLGEEARNVSGDYLPPSEESLAAQLREEEDVDIPEDSSLVVEQYDDMPDVPEDDLFGNPTDTNPSHWYAVSFCDYGGSMQNWDVNPYAETAYQSSITIGDDGC